MSKSNYLQKNSFIDLNEPELIKLMQDVGGESFRINQINNWIYNNYVRSWDEMKNIPSSLISQLEKKIKLHSLDLIEITGVKNDPIRKFLFKTKKGNQIESVLMHDKKRTTICVSSQSGCILDCNFCATASMGFLENLSSTEILDQVLYLASYSDSKITNIVYMGMGEPLMNYRSVMESGTLLKTKMGLGTKRITISTAGIASKIRQIADDNYGFKLAISLNASNENTRNKIMPITKKYSLLKIMKAAEYYFNKTKKLVTFEYVLLKDVNASVSDAQNLMNLLKNFPCKLNVIPYNEIDGDYKRPDIENIESFLSSLDDAPFMVTVRWSNGTDINAGCGQLAVKDTI
ncbi:MAG: 23S rRNA (adenine(2503)-C(2))-methyltransferase RlmN [Candidatus Marinimicrobia bacterium]|nr:23S rRNA (adenine(2503)-C(2))-methyltransferase RlmN [Candidatus Neomarinimicrobiota bacterium]